MTDIFSKSKRSDIMRRVRQKHTNPEMIVRRITHSLGFRYRLHEEKLPGRPDLVFPRLRKVIFVNGCFWHGHSKCRKKKLPASNAEYWKNKIERNRKRDKKVIREIRRLKWDVLVVWECDTIDKELLKKKLDSFLQNSKVGDIDS